MSICTCAPTQAFDILLREFLIVCFRVSSCMRQCVGVCARVECVNVRGCMPRCLYVTRSHLPRHLAHINHQPPTVTSLV